MRTRTLTSGLVAALLAVGAGAGRADAAPGQTCPAGSRVAVVGDSLTAQATDETRWVLAAAGYRVVAYDAAWGRRTTLAGNLFGTYISSGTAAVRAIKSRQRVDCWVIALGTNDAGIGDPGKYARQIDTLMGLIPSTGKVWWLDVSIGDAGYTANPGAPVRGAAWNIALGSATHGWTRLDTVSWADTVAARPGLLEADTVHLSPAGRVARAELILNALQTGA